MTESLLRFKKNQKYICFDFETEGLNLKYSRPWSLSFLVAEGNHVKKEYDYFIEWKDLNVSPEAAKQTKFSIENNGLPFDGLLRNIVDDFTKESGAQTQAVKSIFYRHKEDFKAFQTFKIITNRAFTKRASISAPFLDNCASDRFCMESYLEL